MTNTNPKWWTNEHESGWQRTKDAFRRDWDQTKHDFGGNQPDTHQNVNDTVKQAAGKESIPPRGQPNYEEVEPAYRFGYGARAYYHDKYPEWNDTFETQLKDEWLTLGGQKENWKRDRSAIHHAWEHEFDEDEHLSHRH